MSTTLSYKSDARVAVQRDRCGDSASGWACDALLCTLATAISVLLNHHPSIAWPNFLFGFMAAQLTCGLAAISGSYSSLGVNWRREFETILASTTLGFGVAGLLAALAAARGGLAIEFTRSWGLAVFLLLMARVVRNSLSGKMANPAPAVVLLGNPAQARSLYGALSQETAEQRPRIAAVFSDGANEWPDAIRQNVILSETRWAESFAKCCGIDHAILALPEECDRETEELFKKSAKIFKYLLVFPQLAGGENTVAVTRITGSQLALHVGCHVPHRTSRLKRSVDFVGAFTVGALSSPFIALVALAIKLTSRGPVLYKQVRIGKGNRTFKTLKFRTMYTNAGDRLNEYLATDPTLCEEWESVHKLRRDPRVTVIGRFLRRFSLDELPQLWNVLAGEMSLVGPRPIVVAEIEKYGQDYAAYERARPGLTGLWQVSGRNDTTYQERVDFDSFYVRNWSLGLDARIVLRTFRAVISGIGAY